MNKGNCALKLVDEIIQKSMFISYNGMKDYNMTIRGNLKSNLFGFEVCRLSVYNTRFRTLNICLLYG